MISHHHKAVFVHIPKCGGQSIETMFLEDLGLDWETRLPLLLQPNRNPSIGPPRLAHLLSDEYVRFKYLTAEQFAAYTKFAIIRHPTTRVLSFYKYLKFPGSLDDFVMRWLPKQFEVRDTYQTYPHKYLRNYHFVRPQIEFVSDSTGKCLVDELYYFENMTLTANTICDKFQLSSNLKHVNKSHSRSATLSDLTPAHLNLIESLYAPDFEAFGYK